MQNVSKHKAMTADDAANKKAKAKAKRKAKRGANQ